VATRPQGSPPSCLSPNFYDGACALQETAESKLLKTGNSLDTHLRSSAVSLPRSYDRLFEAFDIAWPTLSRLITDRGLTDDTARRQLADAVLLFAESSRSAAEIAKAALAKLGA
jgi:hypothetical protein